MDGQPQEIDGSVRVAFATWIFRLHQLGVHADDATLAAACARVDATSEAKAGEAAATAFVGQVGDRLAGAADAAAVLSVARGIYGARVGSELGAGTRADRTSRIRRYQFIKSFPWLARIQERHPDGRVGPSWLVVEQLTDQVRAMDPNPWNDIDERRQIPLGDFHVLWELDGCGSVHVR